MWVNIKDSINIFFLFLLLISLKDIRLCKAMIITLCCWVYTTYKCNTYNCNNIKVRGENGGILEPSFYILPELN